MLTIIRNVRVLQNYPFEAMDETALTLLRNAINNIQLEGNKVNCYPLLRVFECFLQITGRKLCETDLTKQGFEDTCRSFIGALHSTKFIGYTHKIAYARGRVWLLLLSAVSETKALLACTKIQLRKTSVTDDVQSCVDLFNREPLVEEKVWLWRGWPSTNRDGYVTYFSMFPVYQKLGRAFTQQFYSVCDQYFSARKTQRIPCLKSLTKYIGVYSNNLAPSDFQNPEFMGRFWRDFFAYYVTTSYGDGNGACISTLITDWRCTFRYFVTGTLIPSGLFAEPWGGFPSPKSSYIYGSHTRLITKDDGAVVKTKLLTHVPLHVSDEEAINILFEHIQHDVDVFVHWAEKTVRDTWSHYKNRHAMVKNGQVRRIQIKGTNSGGHQWKTDRNNPEHLQNAAATFAEYGYMTEADAAVHSLYPCPLSQTAKELGLPVTGSLVSHCILLVTSHPAITPSFLEKLELFDKNGKQVGFFPTDSGYQLISHKDRRGYKLAQQIIPLTVRTTEVVTQIIALTQPLRDYLKDRKDDAWRYLLLTCCQGFAYPVRIKKLSDFLGDPYRVRQLADALGDTSSLSFEKRLELATRFSLTSLRASAGVLVYLNTHSLEKMAKALGHKKYNHRLISYYLPDPLLDFFQERWVRIFQTGMIVEALKQYLRQKSCCFCMNPADFRSLENPLVD